MKLELNLMAALTHVANHLALYEWSDVRETKCIPFGGFDEVTTTTQHCPACTVQKGQPHDPWCEMHKSLSIARAALEATRRAGEPEEPKTRHISELINTKAI